MSAHSWIWRTRPNLPTSLQQKNYTPTNHSSEHKITGLQHIGFWFSSGQIILSPAFAVAEPSSSSVLQHYFKQAITFATWQNLSIKFTGSNSCSIILTCTHYSSCNWRSRAKSAATELVPGDADIIINNNIVTSQVSHLTATSSIYYDGATVFQLPKLQRLHSFIIFQTNSGDIAIWTLISIFSANAKSKIVQCGDHCKVEEWNREENLRKARNQGALIFAPIRNWWNLYRNNAV